MRWLDGIIAMMDVHHDLMDMSLSELRRIVKDREAWSNKELDRTE